MKTNKNSTLKHKKKPKNPRKLWNLALRKTIKEQFKLKYRNQSREQTLVQVNIHHRNFTTDHQCKHISIHTLNIQHWNYFPIFP